MQEHDDPEIEGVAEPTKPAASPIEEPEPAPAEPQACATEPAADNDRDAPPRPEPGPHGPPPPIAPDALAEHLVRLADEIAALNARLDAHLRDTASCSREAFDRLYAEMRQYKDNALAELKTDILTDVMMLLDSIENLRAFYENAEEATPSDVAANLQGLTAEAEEILAREGVTRVIEPDARYDRTSQRAVKTVPTEDADEDMTVVSKIREGFERRGRSFRKADVVVKKYCPPETEASPEAEPTAHDNGPVDSETDFQDGSRANNNGEGGMKDASPGN